MAAAKSGKFKEVLRGPLSGAIVHSGKFIDSVLLPEAPKVPIYSMGHTQAANPGKIKIMQYTLVDPDADTMVANQLTVISTLRQISKKNREMIMGLVLSFFVSYDGRLLEPLTKALNEHGYEWKGAELAEFKGHPEEFCTRFVTEYAVADIRHISVFFIMFVLSMAKSLNGDNYREWCLSRLRGAAASVGLGEDHEAYLEFLPPAEILDTFYKVLPGMWKVRGVMVSYLISMKDGDLPRNKASAWCLKMLEWAEATHLRTIIIELATKRPEMLALPHFRSELPFLSGSLEFLSHFSDNRAHFKLMTNPTIQTPTAAMNFKVMSAVSWALQEKTSGRGKTASDRYKGIRLGMDNPLVSGALAAIDFYDTQLKTSEDEALRQTFGATGVAKFATHLETKAESDD